MAARKATLIVLAWNRWSLTKKCLDTLARTDLSDAEVLVVDNGSTDETPKRLLDYPWVRVVRNAQNLGYVRGNNVGIRAADSGSDIVLLNNDLEFSQRDWLVRMRECAHSSLAVGVVGCRLVRRDGSLLHAGTFIVPETMWGQQIGSGEKDVGQYARNRDVEGVVFACAYLKRETIATIGMLSENFVSYFEDTDYCLRARQAGFRVVLCGGVTLIHDEHGSTSGADEHFSQLFQTSRETFRRSWRNYLTGRYRHDLLWQSILNFSTGYAISSREILRSLEQVGVRTAYDYVYGRGTPFPVDEPEKSDDYLMNVIRDRAAELKPRTAVVYGQGDVFASNRGRRRIGFTMLEVDGFPREWVRQANLMDEVWVPTEFNRIGFLESGLKRPIQKIPLGVDTGYFHPGIRSYPIQREEFVFSANFEWGERKAPELLLKAFNDEFTSREPVRLLCKVINRDPSVSVRQAISRLELKDSGGRIAFLLNLEFPYHELASFYRSTDCFVSAGRGEGWDMPLMEAMACGLPTIATDWGAHREFVHEGISYPLRIRGTVAAEAKCPYYEGFRWADPDPDHLRALLREVYENRDAARLRGQAAAFEVAAKWTWEETARHILDRLDAISS